MSKINLKELLQSKLDEASKLGISQAAISRKSGLSTTTIWKISTEKKSPSMRNAQKIIDAIYEIKKEMNA